MKLYPRNNSPQLDPETFKNPGAEYRGAPFWSWNCALDWPRLLRQIEVFRKMGMGGFHIHSRTGLATEYLGAEFMDLVKRSVEAAKARGMRAWLYDEDRWPSGFAGGKVTHDIRYRARHLLFTAKAHDGSASEATFTSQAAGGRSGRGTLLARYAIRLEDGRLVGVRRLKDGDLAEARRPEDGRLADAGRHEKAGEGREAGAGRSSSASESPGSGMAPGETLSAGETLWYAYLETDLESPWFNNETYVDTLNPEAVKRFIAETHEKYREAVGGDFGGVVPAIFTDEPQFTHKQTLPRAADRRDIVLPWTDDLEDSFRKAYGGSVLDLLPELIWELPGGRASKTRYRYHDHVCERFAVAFADQVGAWCDANGLLLTGHMMEEPSLSSQTRALGEAMRNYRAFGLPGIDMLCDWREYTTAKQAQSAARQYGRPGVLCEIYGVTNWDFDFVGHKAAGDWQAALGVTVRVHHLAWVSMKGEAKRDYPAAIGYQSPWHPEYPVVENHFARLNTVLTRGKSVVRIGVLHPIESFWLAYGPLDQTHLEREAREKSFSDLTGWLLFGGLDFDFISESLLPSQGGETLRGSPGSSGGPAFRVGEMAYSVILVPDLRTIRKSTLDRLLAFQEAGGAIFFLGGVPDLEDAEPSDRPKRLAASLGQAAAGTAPAAGGRIPWRRDLLLAALEPWREITVRRMDDGRRTDDILHQIRQDGENRHLFLCNTEKRYGTGIRVEMRGEWRVAHLDTLSGNEEPLVSEIRSGWTRFEFDLPPHGHLLVTLSPRSGAGAAIPASSPALPSAAPRPVARPKWRDADRLSGPVPVTLSEPNSLLLDRAECRLDDEAWRPAEEILRLDNRLRRRLGWPQRQEALAQPWVLNRNGPGNGNSKGTSGDGSAGSSAGSSLPHRLSLRFTVEVAHPVAAPLLALEEPDGIEIRIGGNLVDAPVTGFWVDEDIATLSLPPLSAGTHKIEVRRPYGPLSNPEWHYLLGDFGVELFGSKTRIVAPVRELFFGDITRQGLPFYGGNVTYHARFTWKGGPLALEAAHFKAPLLKARLLRGGTGAPGAESPDGAEERPLAFAPFMAEWGDLAQGSHQLDLTAFGNRFNAFGCLHNAQSDIVWYGPDAWRSGGRNWVDEYLVRPAGILGAPRLLTY